MTTKSTDFEPTLADAFDVGRKEGLKEALAEVKNMLDQGATADAIKIYLAARLKSIQDFSLNNPFKQKGG